MSIDQAASAQPVEPVASTSTSTSPRYDTQAIDSLSLRPVSADDLDQLVAYRRECTWGEERLRTTFLSPDAPLCIFSTTVEGKEVDVGMGGWVLEEPGGEMASRALQRVKLTSLFISKRYQGLGLGTRALQLLEQGAKIQFGAEEVTLDTAAWTHQQPDGSYIESPGLESANFKRYKAKGYVPFGDIVPKYPNPGREGLLHSVDLKKKV